MEYYKLAPVKFNIFIFLQDLLNLLIKFLLV